MKNGPGTSISASGEGDSPNSKSPFLYYHMDSLFLWRIPYSPGGGSRAANKAEKKYQGKGGEGKKGHGISLLFLFLWSVGFFPLFPSREEEPNPLARVSTRDPKKGRTQEEERTQNPVAEKKGGGGGRGATAGRREGGTKKCGMGRVKEKGKKFVRFPPFPQFRSVG